MALLKIKDTDGTWKAQGNVGVFGNNTEILTFDIDIKETIEYKELDLGDMYRIKRVYGGGKLVGDIQSTASASLFIIPSYLGQYGQGLMIRKYATMDTYIYISFDILIPNTNGITTSDTILSKMYNGVIGEATNSNITNLYSYPVSKSAFDNFSSPVSKINLQYENRSIQLNAGTHLYLWLEVEKATAT